MTNLMNGLDVDSNFKFHNLSCSYLGLFHEISLNSWEPEEITRSVLQRGESINRTTQEKLESLQFLAENLEFQKRFKLINKPKAEREPVVTKIETTLLLRPELLTYLSKITKYGQVAMQCIILPSFHTKMKEQPLYTWRKLIVPLLSLGSTSLNEKLIYHFYILRNHIHPHLHKVSVGKVFEFGRWWYRFDILDDESKFKRGIDKGFSMIARNILVDAQTGFVYLAQVNLVDGSVASCLAHSLQMLFLMTFKGYGARSTGYMYSAGRRKFKDIAPKFIRKAMIELELQIQSSERSFGVHKNQKKAAK